MSKPRRRTTLPLSDWRQVQTPPLIPPTTACYQRDVADGHLSVFVGIEDEDWHLSISHRKNLLGPDGRNLPGRYPSWDEIAEARYRFCPDEVTMAMLLPPKDEYVNVHPTTFHLWEIPNEKGTT
jgi:hypothetical protein